MASRAPVTFDAPVVERGVGFFETVLVLGRRLVLYEQHLDRLARSLHQWEFPSPSLEEVAEAVREVLSSRGAEFPKEQALRLSWIAIAPDLDARESWRLDVSLRGIPPLTLERRREARLVTLPSSLQRDCPGTKSTSYFGAIAGLRYAVKNGGNEGLLVSPSGNPLEGTSTGMAVFDGVTWVVSCGATLPSVTLAAFLELPPARQELGPGDILQGAVLAGSLTKVTPVRFLDGRACGCEAEVLSKIERFNHRLESDPSLSTEF